MPRGFEDLAKILLKTKNAIVYATAIAFCLADLLPQPSLAFALKDKDGSSIHGSIMKEAIGNRVSAKNLKMLIKICDETFPTSGQYFFPAEN